MRHFVELFKPIIYFQTHLNFRRKSKTQNFGFPQSKQLTIADNDDETLDQVQPNNLRCLLRRRLRHHDGSVHWYGISSNTDCKD